jgi:hypothetical protein
MLGAALLAKSCSLLTEAMVFHACDMMARCLRAGLEVFFVDGALGGASSGNARQGGEPSVFLAFGSEEERDAVATVIAEQPSLGAALPGGREAAAACGSILEVGDRGAAGGPCSLPAHNWEVSLCLRAAGYF